MKTAVLTSVLLCIAWTRGLVAAPPNIILIMSDDMGYADLGCYGSEIETPVLDQLASQGIRFTQFYNTSRCCPTRAALMTGLYSHQAGMGLMTRDRGVDGYRGDLNRRCVTLAEVLGAAGYRNYMVGKWHLTKQISPDGDKRGWPRQRGFDRFYGTITGAGSFFDPATLCRDNTFITPVNDEQYQPETFYYTDAISDHAVRFISDHYEHSVEQPFFLYVAYTCPHWPLHALESEIAKYDGRYDQGYGAIRQARHERAIAQGVVHPEWPLSSAAVSWDQEHDKAWNARCMEVFAAMVDRMDQGIGRIVSELKSQNALENTLIVYLQDNGGCAEGLGRRSNLDDQAASDFKALGPDELQSRIWPPMQTRDGRWVKTGPDVMPGEEDTFVAYGTGWANVSNTPFRGYKHDALEGGISTPMIMHWPAGIVADRRGAIVSDIAHLIDVMPTFVETAGAKYPDKFAGMAIQPLEGMSLVPILSGNNRTPRPAPLGFEHHGNCALRDGRWKIVSTYRQNQPRDWELYDMDNDRTELHNLAAQMPERTAQMAAQWQAWADRVGVQPWPF